MKKITLALASLLASGSLAFSQLSPTIDNDGTYSSGLAALASSVLDGSLDPGSDAAWMSGSDAGLPTLNTGEIWDIIFIGEFAGWKNDLHIGLNLEGDGSVGGGSSVVDIFEDVDMSTISTGDYRRLVVTGDIAGYYDFILNSSDGTAGGVNGGMWRMFTPANNEPGSDFDYGYTGAQDAYALFAFEDWNQNQPGVEGGPVQGAPDMDRNDFVFGMRYVGTTAVPEPSTYGLIGASALVVLLVSRRLKRAK